MNAERYSAVTESTTSPESPDNKHLTPFVAEDRKGADVCSQPRSREDLVNALDEDKLRQVIDTIPTIAWCNLPDGPNEFLNKRWHDYAGLTPEESNGWGWQAAVHPEDLPRLMDKWLESLASGEPGEIEARLRRHDGVFRWFLIRAEPLRDETGKIIRWYGISTDIEILNRTEEKLRDGHVGSERVRCAIGSTSGAGRDPGGFRHFDPGRLPTLRS